MAQVAVCVSHNVDQRYHKTIEAVVRQVMASGRGVATPCDNEGDAVALRACFDKDANLVAPGVQVFAAFGPDGQGADSHSATTLADEVSRHPAASEQTAGGPRIVVHWWAGGDATECLNHRQVNRTARMVQAVAASGKCCGLIAFVGGGDEQSWDAWGAVYQAYKRNVPVVVFACGCQVRWFPALGRGHWRTAGQGIWGQAWMWEEEVPGMDGIVPTVLSHLLNWQPAPPRQRKVELDLPFMLNLRRWLWQMAREE